MAVGLIWNLIFWLHEADTGISRLIHGNPITDKLWLIYLDIGLPSLLSIPISFVNAAYTIMWLEAMHKSKSTTPKRLIKCLIYLAVSLGALVIHWITFHYIFSSIIASV